MKVKIRLFAILRDIAKIDWIELDLPEGSTGKDLLIELGKKYPPLKGTIEKSAIAVNENYLMPDETIPENAEIAIIPPVSGGTIEI
jgi:molybdopterin converting factor subunit 1